MGGCNELMMILNLRPGPGLQLSVCLCSLVLAALWCEQMPLMDYLQSTKNIINQELHFYSLKKGKIIITVLNVKNKVHNKRKSQNLSRSSIFHEMWKIRTLSRSILFEKRSISNTSCTINQQSIVLTLFILYVRSI